MQEQELSESPSQSEPQQSQSAEEIPQQPPSSPQNAVVAQPRSALGLRNGSAAPASVEEQFRLARMYIDSKMIPERFKTPAQVVAAMHYAAEHFPEKPLTAIRQIAVINGNPCLFGDLPLAIVQRSWAFAGKREFFIDKSGTEISYQNKNLAEDVWGAVCITRRRSRAETDIDEHTTVFTFDDAERAGLTGKGVWKSYPKIMLKMRSRSQNLKDNFADCLNGIGIAEHDAHSEYERVLVQGRRSSSDAFTSDYLEAKDEPKDAVK